MPRMNRRVLPLCPNLRTRLGSVPGSAPGAAELQRAKVEVGRIGPTGRSTSEDNNSAGRRLGHVNPTVDTTYGTRDRNRRVRAGMNDVQAEVL